MATLIFKEFSRRLCRQCRLKSLARQKTLNFYAALPLSLQVGHHLKRHTANYSSDTINNRVHETDVGNHQLVPEYADIGSTACVPRKLLDDMVVYYDFVSESEEQNILKEIEPYMARLRYEYSHWDDAIHGYRETERSTWNQANSLVIDRLKKVAFSDVASPTEYVHVLDLEEKGEIKPHKDAVRYCGDTIAGISLLSDSVMRLVSIDNKDTYVDILLKRRSLYIIRHTARYDFTHEVLPNDRSYFKQKHIHKGRRISVICRNNPNNQEDS